MLIHSVQERHNPGGGPGIGQLTLLHEAKEKKTYQMSTLDGCYRMSCIFRDYFLFLLVFTERKRLLKRHHPTTIKIVIKQFPFRCQIIKLVN